MTHFHYKILPPFYVSHYAREEDINSRTTKETTSTLITEQVSWEFL